jgi:hypothetical protein
MFEVYEKKSNTKKTVYGVHYKKGYPFFTFYENGQWISRSAKHYMPVEEVEDFPKISEYNYENKVVVDNWGILNFNKMYYNV